MPLTLLSRAIKTREFSSFVGCCICLDSEFGIQQHSKPIQQSIVNLVQIAPFGSGLVRL